MRLPPPSARAAAASATLATALVVLGVAVAAAPRQARLALRASPSVGLAPTHVAVTARLEDVADEEAVYCATVEWEWGDGSLSRSSRDCAPFDASRGDRARRYYRRDHVYGSEGEFVVEIRLLQGDEVVASGCTAVRVLR